MVWAYLISSVILTISFICSADYQIQGQECSQFLECSHCDCSQVIVTIIQLNIDQSCVENGWQQDFQAPALCSLLDRENALYDDKLISGLQPCGKDADNCLESNESCDSKWVEHCIISEEKWAHFKESAM